MKTIDVNDIDLASVQRINVSLARTHARAFWLISVSRRCSISKPFLCFTFKVRLLVALYSASFICFYRHSSSSRSNDEHSIIIDRRSLFPGPLLCTWPNNTGNLSRKLRIFSPFVFKFSFPSLLILSFSYLVCYLSLFQNYIPFLRYILCYIHCDLVYIHSFFYAFYIYSVLL